MATKTTAHQTHDSNGTHTSPKKYIIGFTLSLGLTLEAYYLTISHNFSAGSVITMVLGLAIVQLLVQLFFFIHLERAVKAPWNIIMFLAMAAVVITLVFGSLWVMRHLDYNHHHTIETTNDYIKRNEDL